MGFISVPRIISQKAATRYLRTSSAFGLLLLVLALPAKLMAEDFTYVTNSGVIIITGYTGLEGVVTIPNEINGLMVGGIGKEAFGGLDFLVNITISDNVTNIGSTAFLACSGLTNVTLGNSVQSIEVSAFVGCSSLTSVTIPNSVTSIGQWVFQGCSSLNSVTIGTRVSSIGKGSLFDCSGLSAISVDPLNSNFASVDGVLFNKTQTTLVQFPAGRAGSYTSPGSVTTIGNWAFANCTSLTNLTIGNGLTNIGDYAFSNCFGLTGIYFQGNAPSYGGSVFYQPSGRWGYPATIYYLPGTIGWGSTFDFVPALPWLPQVQTSDASFGVGTNGFAFNINWASGMTVVVEACTSLANPVWSPLATNTLTSVLFHFSDPQWTNYPGRFYRLRWP